MISAGDFRKGITLEMENGIWTIVDFQHVKPGKGAAFVRTKIKNVVTGGVLERPGHTEAAVDLARLAGLPPGGVLCEILNPDGTMARLPQLQEFKRKFRLKMGSVEALKEYRLATGR